MATPIRTRSALLAVLLLPALAACKLIDQRTFDPSAGLPPAPQVTPGPAPVPPLLTIRLNAPQLGYGDALQQQVTAAAQRKPDVQFDVVTVVPANGTAAQQVAAASAVIGDARSVARAINGSGIDDSQIHLLAQSEPGLAAREIRVFVR